MSTIKIIDSQSRDSHTLPGDALCIVLYNRPRDCMQAAIVPESIPAVGDQLDTEQGPAFASHLADVREGQAFYVLDPGGPGNTFWHSTLA